MKKQKRLTVCRLYGVLFAAVMALGFVRAEDAEAASMDSLLRVAGRYPSVKVYTDICRQCYAESNPEGLLRYADSLQLYARRTNKDAYYAQAHIYRGEGYFLTGDVNRGFAEQREGIRLYQGVRLDSLTEELLVTAYSDLGYYCNLTSRYDSARYFLNQGLCLAEKLNRFADQVRVMLVNRASSFMYEGENDSALVYTHMAQERIVADKDTAMLIETFNHLGTIYRRQKRIEECVEAYKQAIRLSELQNNLKTAGIIYSNVSVVFCDWGRLDEAVYFVNKAVEYSEKTGDEVIKGAAYANLGIILCKMADRKEEGMRVLTEKALPLLNKVGNKRMECSAYQFLVLACLDLDRVEQAELYMEHLEELIQQLKQPGEWIRYYGSKARLLIWKKKYAEAIVCLKKIKDIYKSGYEDPYDYGNYRMLADCYFRTGMNLEAYEALQVAYRLRDSVFQEEKTQQLSDLTVKYQTQQKELQIVRLNQKNLEQKALYYQTVVVAALVLLVLIVLLSAALVKRQKQKVRIAQMERQVGEKEKEFLKLSGETEKRLTRKYIEGLESERERLAKELHDDVCNSLLTLEMEVRNAYPALSKTTATHVEMLAEIRNRVRTVSHELMPPAFQYVSIDEMLEDLVEHMNWPSNTTATYESTPEVDWNLVPAEISFELYRIAQEALSNVLKYSKATRVQISLAWEEGIVKLVISDNGQGFEVEQGISKGIGLRTIRQRIESVGGRLLIESAPSEGTCITAFVRKV